jgi:tRNA(fMet)-specific endonuclease VapC
MFMLDTHICSYVLKNRDQRLRAKFKAIKDLVISSITYAELCFGIENWLSEQKL